MKRISLIVLLVLTLFISQAVVNVSAGPLNSFAENPIPYWDDDSLDVSPTWDSTEQTVTIGWENETSQSEYWEDFGDISDWNAINDPISTDGDIATITTSGDDTFDRYDCNVPDGSTDWTDYTYKMRFKTNVTDTKLAVTTNTLDDFVGDGLYLKFYVTMGAVGVWTIHEETITHDNPGTEECISLLMKHASVNAQVDIDYIRVFDEIGELDLGIPIIPQDTQEIEVYVNSTNLNSEVRLEIYDDTEALGTYCTFNSTHVIFPDSEYAQTDGLSRIAFTLDNARMIGTITVFDGASNLINAYNDSSLISGTTFLRMNSTVFNGSFILFYINGDTTYSAELSIIEELFLSTNMIGYFGPLALVVIGYLITKKNKELGIFMIIVDSLIIWQYFALIEATPDYWWHVIILLLGVVLCAIQMMDR